MGWATSRGGATLWLGGGLGPPKPKGSPSKKKKKYKKKKKKYNFYPYSLKKLYFWPPQSLKPGSAPGYKLYFLENVSMHIMCIVFLINYS